MSIQITGKDGYLWSISDRSDGKVGLHHSFRSSLLESSRVLSRADFLAAVETELGVRIVAADAIVLDRAELPEVMADRHGLHVDGLTVDSATTHYDAIREMRAYAAVFEYLDAHPPTPPVDEADVETLGDLISTVTAGIDPFEAGGAVQFARRLLATGKVEVRQS